MKRVAVLNYGLGNIRSVENAIKHVGALPDLTSDGLCIHQADALIIPGVGSFPHGMEMLQNRGLVSVINDFSASGKPILGICLGMQMLFETGLEFSETAGLGLLKGCVDIMRPKARLPHIAWSETTFPGMRDDSIFHHLQDKTARFYYVHSFSAQGVDETDVVARCTYGGVSIVAAVNRGNVWGVQFHPEKSGPVGLGVIKNFIENSRG